MEAIPAILKGKVAIVTGGAGGIGRATASIFLDAGASVVLIDRNAARLNECVADFDSDRCIAIEADATSETAIAEYFAAAVDRFGTLDVLFANAGILDVPAPVADFPFEAWNHSIAVNLLGTFLNVQAAIRTFQRRGGPGSIVCTASGAALEGVPTKSAYAAAKHGVLGLVRSAALEVAAQGIRINALLPGMTDTGMMTAPIEAAGQLPGGLPPAELRRALEAKIPMRRWASPKEIGLAALFLASDMSSYVTGSALVVDGGLTV